MTISDVQKYVCEAKRYDPWEEPDMRIISYEEEPPVLPLHLLDLRWQKWIADMAEAKGCSPDFIFGSL
jgi:hypothetical protein